MGFHRGPNIVTEGLKLSLDAGNEKSYPGTGTIWYDLSGSGRHMTTNAVASYHNTIGEVAYWYFPDIDNQRFIGSGGSGDFSNGSTINMWINPESGGTIPGSCGLMEPFSGYNIAQNRLWYDSSSGAARCQTRLYSDGTFSSTNVFTNSSWQQLTMLYYNNGGVGKIEWYRNGVYLNSVLDDQEYAYGNVSNTLYIGSIQGNSYKYKGKIAIVKQYNRALTQAEITQNYNAQKSRFNL